MILNETPVKTTNNYGINNINFDIDLDNKLDKNINIESLDIDKLVIKKDNSKINSKIGLTADSSKIEITIPKNKKLNDVYIKYTFDELSKIDEIKINLEENSSARFYIIYKSKNNNKITNYLKQSVYAKENSKANITIVNLLNNNSTNLIAIENKVKDYANVYHNYIDLGANVKITNYYSELFNHSKSKLYNTYLGIKENIIDMNYHVKLYGEKSKCKIKVEGALKDKSKKSFKGTIDFISGAKKSVGEEIENCILLSDKAISKSLPMLLCSEEDVEGSHGVSTGEIEKNKLFYIKSRGISENDAKKLIVLANMNKVIKKIKNEEIEKEIIDFINERI